MIRYRVHVSLNVKSTSSVWPVQYKMAIATKTKTKLQLSFKKNRHKKCREKCSVDSEVHFYLLEKLTFREKCREMIYIYWAEFASSESEVQFCHRNNSIHNQLAIFEKIKQSKKLMLLELHH